MDIEGYKKVNKILHERIKTLGNINQNLYKKIRKLKKGIKNE